MGAGQAGSVKDFPHLHAPPSTSDPGSCSRDGWTRGPHRSSRPLGDTGSDGDSHHLSLPSVGHLAQSCASQHEATPVPILWLHPSVPRVLSQCHLHLALGSESIYGKAKRRSSGWMVSVCSEEGAWATRRRSTSLNPVCPFLSCQDYPSYPSFPQNQYPQYFSPSYNPPYVPAGSLCSSPLSTSTYVLQEAPHSVPSQSSESLAGKLHSRWLSPVV